MTTRCRGSSAIASWRMILRPCMCLLAFAFLCATSVQGGPPGRGTKPVTWHPEDYDAGLQVVRDPLPHETVLRANVPDSFDWGNVKGLSFLTRVGNQMLPRGCGSCWAFSTAGSVSDRIKIGTYAATGRLPTDVNLAVQALLDCGAANSTIGGCHGGSAQNAFSFMHDHGIPDETCAPYVAAAPGWWSEEDCWDTLCRVCDRHGNCRVTNDGKMHRVGDFGLILPSGSGDTDDMVFRMQAEIMQRGPIVCGMYAHSSSFDDYLPAKMGNYTDSVIVDSQKYDGITHDIELVGWGVSEGSQIPYWIGKNSYGTRWGLEGFFRIQRGANTLKLRRCATGPCP